MASICNDDWASLGVMSGHERKTLRLSANDLYARVRLVELAQRARLAVVASLGEVAEAGALFSYGGSRAGRFRRAAQLMDKILRGATPGDLPVEQSADVEFVLNAKAARALGITIPPAVLLRADRIIE